MPTVRYAVEQNWVKVADNADTQFLIENEQFVNILATYTPTGVPPAVDAPGHQLKGREAMVRVGDGDVYVKSANPDVNSSVVVSIQSV